MKKGKVSWFGSALIVMGIVLLLRAVGMVDIRLADVIWIVLVLAGISWIVGGFRNKRRSRIFWGTLVASTALYILFSDIHWLDSPSYYLFIVIMLEVGLACTLCYLSAPSEIHLLVPALFFSGLGLAMLFTEFGYLTRSGVVSALNDYWPMVLVLFGLTLLLPALRRSSDHP